MRFKKAASICVALSFAAALAGCGVSNNKYDALMNEKTALEDKVASLEKNRNALKNEYDNLLKEKMDASTRLAVVTNEKEALKGEYDKILDEKITLKAAYDKLVADEKASKGKPVSQ